MFDNSLPSGVTFGVVNGHIIGDVMREAVRRAIAVARTGLFIHQVTVKGIKEDGGKNVVTDYDKEAQRRMVRKLRECFPDSGLIGEEDNLRFACRIKGVDAYFTIDPIDGTSAYTRKQSSGFGPMIAFVVNGRVVGACIGDAMTEELYYYRPGSSLVHRLSERDVAVVLNNLKRDKPLAERHVLLRDHSEMYSETVQRLIRSPSRGGLFKGVQITCGSIGLSSALLWKDEVAMQILRPSNETPWDSSPVIGFSLMLGFVFLRVESDGRLTPVGPVISKVEWRRDYELIMVHRNYVDAVLAWSNAKQRSV